MFIGEFKKISGTVVSQNAESAGGVTLLEVLLRMDAAGDAEAEIPFVTGVCLLAWATLGSDVPAQDMRLDVTGKLGRLSAQSSTLVTNKTVSHTADTPTTGMSSEGMCAGKCNVKISTPSSGAANSGKTIAIGLLFVDPFYNTGT